MRWRWWRTGDEMAADFAADRDPEMDDHFVAQCGLPDTPEAVNVALAVRRSVASYGAIKPDFIRALDRYPDELIGLSNWDSLDFFGWMIELERELDIPVTEEAFKDIRPPFTVKDLAQAAYGFVHNQAAA